MPNSKDYLSRLMQAAEAQVQLYSVFDRITANGSAQPPKRNLLSPSVLSENNIVPSAATGGQASSAPQIVVTQADQTTFSTLHPNAQEETWYYLLQKYGWRIGDHESVTNEPQHVPFCDAERVRRALSHQGDQGYLLVKGDLAGIQGYIYGGIQQKTAGGLAKLSKRLRGRSIMVTLLTDFLANIALQELELPVWNLLFAGGGHFNLLLPDSPGMRDKLKELTSKLDQEMRRLFDDRLQLIVASVACTAQQIQHEAGQCFERLNAEREHQKYRQHSGNLSEHFYPASDRQSGRIQDEAEIEIGRIFPKMDILVEAVSDGPIFKATSKQVLVNFNMKLHAYTLLVANDQTEAKQLLAGAPNLVSARVYALNDTDFMPKQGWSDIQQPVSFGFRFIGRHVPFDEKNDRPKTFEEITQSDALEMLGSIRLDVDDLGYIFSHGMTSASLAQIAALSREMHYFFSVHFDRLAEKHHLYLIYSGGDDAFAVGQWADLIEFAKVLKSDFDRFVFNNPNVHFSAGIFLGDPKYPVGRFYRDTGELLDEAKRGNQNKDRIHIFHQITDWGAFEKKIEFGKGLSELLDKKDKGSTRKLSMAFAYRLLTLAKTSIYERADTVEGKTIRRGSLNTKRFAHNISRLHYLFARHGYNSKQIDEVTNKIEKELINDYFRNFKFGGKTAEKSIRDNIIALNYALYTIRSQKNTETQHD